MNKNFERIIEYDIPDSFINHKISELLKFLGFSQQLLATLRNTECSIYLKNVTSSDENSMCVRMNHKITPDDIIYRKLQINIPYPHHCAHIFPVDLPFEILYEDEDLFVINKPAGMPVHPSTSNPDNSLANALAHLYLIREEPFVFRCVNRLDKNTTGLTIVAKNALSAGILYQDVKNRIVKRTYFALVDDLDHTLPENGKIVLPISRDESTERLYSIKRFIDYENGAYAETHYKCLTHIKGIDSHPFALVQLDLKTGRTHQIRVHMAAIGHPLIGDNIYNETNTMMSRHALHAGKLEFFHPVSRIYMSFQTELPADMKSFIPPETLKYHSL